MILNKQKLKQEKLKLEQEDKGSFSVTRRSTNKAVDSKGIFSSICTMTDHPNNMHAAGTYNAKKTKLIEHTMRN